MLCTVTLVEILCVVRLVSYNITITGCITKQSWVLCSVLNQFEASNLHQVLIVLGPTQSTTLSKMVNRVIVAVCLLALLWVQLFASMM